MPYVIYPFNEDECQICGEPADDEMGEFILPDDRGSIYAHGQCGLDHHLKLA
jgi:hypothetical protein